MVVVRAIITLTVTQNLQIVNDISDLRREQVGVDNDSDMDSGNEIVF